MTKIYIEDMSVGQTASFSRTITESDLVLFAGVSGDFNPIHINADYAATTKFGKRIAHGMLVASLISTVAGTQLPGEGAIYVSQSTNFRAPVFIGDTVTATVIIKEINLVKKRITLSTACHVRDKLVMEGESLLIAPSRAALKDK